MSSKHAVTKTSRDRQVHSLRGAVVLGPNSSQAKLLVQHQASQGLQVPLHRHKATHTLGSRGPLRGLPLLVSPHTGLPLVELQLPQHNTRVTAIQAMAVLPSSGLPAGIMILSCLP